MDWRNLELLRCVVESGGFTSAARVAGVSQPAISQAMQRLENQIGLPLFERQGRRRIPTAKALELSRAMQRAEDDLRPLLQDSAGASPPAHERGVRVGLAPAAGLLYGPGMVNVLAKAGFRTRMSITTGPAPEMLEALKCGELDIVVAPRPRGSDDGTLCEHLMYVSQPLIYCRQGHPLAKATSLREITRAHWVVAGQSGTPGNVVEEAFRVRRWSPPRIAVQCTDYAMLVQIVAGSDLLGVVSHPRLVAQSTQQGIVALSVEEGLPHYEVCLFWPRRIPRREALIRRIIENLTSS
ncbi:LysR family transcriptional regulator [Ottowia thiooxydans]|uniref:LysR family transcriptional regulator n=1 Tax=Ottowia thiooxydans TaxID=219182 RepID=UPI000409F6EF|nr:LysR family transcriptional regulator [Ottowia thiooxydans]